MKSLFSVYQLSKISFLIVSPLCIKILWNSTSRSAHKQHTERAISRALCRKVSIKQCQAAAVPADLSHRPTALGKQGLQKSALPHHFPGSHRTHTTYTAPSDIPLNIFMNHFTCKKWRNHILPYFQAPSLMTELKRFLNSQSILLI